MKKVTTYYMKGVLYLEAGQVVETRKVKGGGGAVEEIAHDYKEILEMLNGEDVVFSFKRVEEIDD